MDTGGIRSQLERLLEMTLGGFHPVLGKRAMMTAEETEIVSVHVAHRSLRGARFFLAEKLDFQLGHDGERNLVLNVENVG